MNSRVMFSILALFMLSATSIQAASMGSSGMNLRCRCIRTSAIFIHPKFMENIDIIPPGPHCETVNIIATLKNGNMICLEPKAIWVQRVINRMINERKKKEKAQ
ncbi:interleukin-8-like [Amblyraja radiata]|uniref:interleukin-8-like n=1 Tax=Amblyraja radiata TaxID=386614 RepID=UPI0014028381|nr:interleukin-8-like [Amblyraja radiata]XP_032873144.1 interleukin-8-like [Amblyraja radiata]XP_032873242.1 interleukin-8-like [Amblyraja radiata]